ncbi:Zn-II 2Cys6 regulatory protein [Decorospora gaudefroyi]|uniref:Zn-II 2Cys6 regulatory protein n=1 Tax=Decorospora gaudefroyi TaxID=184978 RepID=A0A6A5KI54_9PLEO|nr:Zn-II 2Cys6 regulatory protein [Decorospora gaudefroyi]
MNSRLTVPKNSMLATGPNGEQKPRKMRASCDACSRAKVKCDKVRPTCHRCGNMGICCNYSPSMRLGKPRKHRNPDGTTLRAVSPASSCGPLGTRADLIPRTTATTTYTSESSPEPTDPFFFGPGTPEYHYQDAFMSNGFDGNQSPAYSDGTGPLSGAWANDDHMMFQNQADMFVPVTPFLPAQTSYSAHTRSTSVQSQPEMFTTLDAAEPYHINFGMPDPMFVPHEKMMASPSPAMTAPLPTPPVSATLPNHDCTQFAFQTLNSLYAPPESQPSAGDFTGTGDGLPTLDTVITTNQAAVEKLNILLGCPCSSNPHFSTTIAFTIVKILSWYQAIAGVNNPGEDSPLETQMEAFIHSSISMGAFRPEHDDTFRTNLVLSELRKVEKLIDKFSERYCKAANAAETGIEGGVYGALEALLRTRVRDTFKVTMRSAPASVKHQVASRAQNRLRVHTL